MDPNIKAEFWCDPDLEAASVEMKLTFLWLLTNSNRNLCGATLFSTRKFISDTQLDPALIKETEQVMNGKVIQCGSWIWVKNFIRHQFGRGELLLRNKTSRRLQGEIARLPETLQKTILSHYPELRCGYRSPDGDGKGIASPSEEERLDGDGKGIASPRAEPSRAEPSIGGLGEKNGGEKPEPVIPTVEEMARRLMNAGVPMETIQRYHNWATVNQKWLIRDGMGRTALRLWTMEVIQWARDSRTVRMGQKSADLKALKGELREINGTLQWMGPEKEKHAEEFERLCRRRKELEGMGVIDD
jgi:hypothetical protein